MKLSTTVLLLNLSQTMAISTSFNKKTERNWWKGRLIIRCKNNKQEFLAVSNEIWNWKLVHSRHVARDNTLACWHGGGWPEIKPGPIVIFVLPAYTSAFHQVLARCVCTTCNARVVYGSLQSTHAVQTRHVPKQCCRHQCNEWDTIASQDAVLSGVCARSPITPPAPTLDSATKWPFTRHIVTTASSQELFM